MTDDIIERALIWASFAGGAYLLLLLALVPYGGQ